MQELKCPNCGKVFQVDDTGYAQIVQQVRDAELEKEVARREREMAQAQADRLKLLETEQERKREKEISGKDAEIARRDLEIERLKAELDRADAEQMKGKRILIVDDVVSTGESLHAIEELVRAAGGIICGRMTILAEGDAASRDDLVYLEKLPLFDSEGNPIG